MDAIGCWSPVRQVWTMQLSPLRTSLIKLSKKPRFDCVKSWVNSSILDLCTMDMFKLYCFRPVTIWIDRFAFSAKPFLNCAIVYLIKWVVAGLVKLIWGNSGYLDSLGWSSLSGTKKPIVSIKSSARTQVFVDWSDPQLNSSSARADERVLNFNRLFIEMRLRVVLTVKILKLQSFLKAKKGVLFSQT